MTSYSDSGQQPVYGQFLAFDHLHFWVGNSLQAAAYYICRFGFEPYAYRGLETGSRDVMTQVVRQNDVVFAFSSPLQPSSSSPPSSQITQHTAKHGDGVKDVAFRVSDCVSIYEYAVSQGALPVHPPCKMQYDQGEDIGTLAGDYVVTATIEAPYKDTWHTFIEYGNSNTRTSPVSNKNNTVNYKHVRSAHFLPGYRKAVDTDPQLELVETPGLQFVDHVVANQPDGEMERVCNWYTEKLQFRRFWSVDDSQLYTKYSSLRSVVMTDWGGRVKMPINEPAAGLRRSQIQEFVDHYGGPGVQHIALNTSDIVTAIRALKRRGVAFINIPSAYYDDLRARLAAQRVDIGQDLMQLRKLGILVDFDEDGYLLQIFTKPLQDRPTVFIEVIQRCSHEGFGVGNFKSLFEAIEREQSLRGNL